MKKFMVISAGLCLALSFTSCKSSDSAYKQAYEKAKSQEASQRAADNTPTVTETPVVTPVQTVPANQGRVVDNYDNVSVRQEQVTLVSGAGLQAYSVVVGSFSIIANAEGLQQRLRNAGYQAQIVKNEDRNMYRVVATTSNDKGEAVRSRDALRGTELNPQGDAWLLYSQR
ncbi:MAG: SPOR domain-containing protein [Prevotella sp.]|nr:SPOR domain-containing protein [Prevotella sp.]